MKNALWVITLVCLLLLSGCGHASNTPDVPKYYLTIPREGVCTILVSTPVSSGGCRNVDRSPFQKGEQLWLEQLDSFDDLRGITITALDENENVLWQCEIPDSEENQNCTAYTDRDWKVQKTK